MDQLMLIVYFMLHRILLDLRKSTELAQPGPV